MKKQFKRQVEVYQMDHNFYYWKISFLQFSMVPLTNEEYDQAAKALEDKMQEIELKRLPLDSNNQQNK